MAGPTPTGVTRVGSHPALRIPAPREPLRSSQTQALAPRSQQQALPARRNPLIGASSGEPGTERNRLSPNKTTAAAHPRHGRAPGETRGVPASPNGTPAPAGTPDQSFQPHGKWPPPERGGRGGNEGGRNANTPLTCPNTFPPGSFRARELLPSWGNLDEDRSWEELPNPTPTPSAGLQPAGQGKGLSTGTGQLGGGSKALLRGDPHEDGDPLYLEGLPDPDPHKLETTHKLAFLAAPFSFPWARSKMHARGPQGQACMIFPWQTSKRNILPFHPTI